MANSSISPSGPAYSDINLSSVVNRSSTGTSVHGFKSKEIVISAQAVQACKIEDLELYDYADMNGTVLGTPSEVVTASVLKGYQQADGSIRIPLADFPGIAYLRYIRIHYEDFYGSGKAAGSSLQLDLYGDTDWFGNLDASANLVQDDEDYTDNKGKVCSGGVRACSDGLDPFYKGRPAAERRLQFAAYADGGKQSECVVWIPDGK